MTARALLLLLASAIGLALGAACLALGENTGRPNVVLLVGDDHGRADTGCYGSADARTPNLDRLADEGARFTGMHAVTAICQPSRAALFTGRYPMATGVYGFYPLERGIEPVTVAFAEAGYSCALVGKRHIAPLDRFRFSFSRPMTKEEGRQPLRYAADVRAFLDGRDDDAPFLLVVAFHDAHRPFPTTGVAEGPGAASRIATDRERIVVPDAFPDTPTVREDVAGYLDAVARLDVAVGAVLGALDDRELLDEALVIYTSDHGPAFPFAKTTLYERGLAVPFLVRFPGHVPAGIEVPGLLSLIDVAPTLLEVAGLAPQPEMDGTSFLPHLRGEARRARSWLFASQTDHLYLPSTPMRAVRDTRWAYVYNFAPDRLFLSDALQSPVWRAMMERAETDPEVAGRVARFLRRPTEELYDLASDPDETANLAADPAFADELARLRTLLVDAMDEIDDPFLTQHPDASEEQRERLRSDWEDYVTRQGLRLENRRLRQLREEGEADDDAQDLEALPADEED